MEKTTKTLAVLISSIVILLLSVGVFNLFGFDKGANTLVANALSAEYSVWDHVDYGAGPGTGTATDPYVITTAAQLNTTLRNNAGTANKYFVLMSDINLNDGTLSNYATAGWTSIPNLAAGSVFDGNNYTISNLKMATTSASASNKGFFLNVSGTVQNVTFQNPQIGASNYSVATTTTYGVGVVAATALGNAKSEQFAVFSRIFVQCDSSTAGLASHIYSNTDYGTGAIVGFVQGSSQSSGAVKIEYCYNNVPINGTMGHIAGILGRVNTGAIARVTECANYGNITVTSPQSGQSGEGVGGIVGCSEADSVQTASQTSIDWCYNCGNITGGHAGIFGQSNGTFGSTSVMNCYNNSTITNSASGAVNAGIATIAGNVEESNNWYNSDLYNPSPARAFVYRQTFTTPPAGVTFPSYPNPAYAIDYGPGGNGPLSFSSINLQDLVDKLNRTDSSVLQTNKFVLYNGQVQLRSLIRMRPIVYEPGDFAAGQQQIDNVLPDTQTITLPDGSIVGDRVGYEFAGWDVNGTVYQAGQTAIIGTAGVTSSDLVIIKATFKKLTYEIDFISGGTLLDSGNNAVTTFQIDDANLKLNIDTANWPAGASRYWMALKSGATDQSDMSNWVQISNINNFVLSDLISENSQPVNKFLETFIQPYDAAQSAAHNGDAGVLTIRFANPDDVTLVNIIFGLSGENAGQLTIYIDDAPLAVNSGTQTSLPTSGTITGFSVDVNDYYKFLNIEIYDNQNPMQLVTTITDLNDALPLGGLTDYNLDITQTSGTRIRSGFTIQVNFAKIQYQFELKAAVNGMETDTTDSNLADVITTNRADAVSIGENGITVSADAQMFSDDGMYQFVAWKIYDSTLAGTSSYAEYARSAQDLRESFNIDANWLSQHLYTDSTHTVSDGTATVLIVAEYIKMCRVSISTELGPNGENYGSAEITYVSIIDNSVKTSGSFNDLIPEGSIISYRVTPLAAYQVESLGDISSDVKDGVNAITFQVSADRNIVITFTPIQFAIQFSAVDGAGRTLQYSGSFGINVNGTDMTILEVGDTLSNLSEVDISNYAFVGFMLVSPETQMLANLADLLDNQGSLLVTSDLIACNVKNSGQTSAFVIVAQYKVNIVLPLTVSVSQSTAAWGSFDVYVGWVDESNKVDIENINNFAYGTQLIVVAQPISSFYYAVFAGGLSTEIDSQNPLDLIITMTTPRTITLRFTPVIVEIDDTLAAHGGGNAYVNRAETLRIDDQMTFEAEPDNGKCVTGWSINGVSIDHLINLFPTTFALNGNSLTVTITPDWYTAYGSTMNTLVQFGFTTEFLIMIILPIAFVLLLFVIFLALYLNLRKKKRIIKKYLQADKDARQGFTFNQYVGDVRKNKETIGISKEAVKAELNARKKKK